MVKCVNNKCDKNPIESIDSKLASPDGDFACNDKCLKNMSYSAMNSLIIQEMIDFIIIG